MGSINKAIIVGRLGQDPKVSYTTNGNAVANLSVATDNRYKDINGQWKSKTEWHRVVVFGQQAEFCGNYLNKGSLVAVEGKIQTSKWKDQQGQDRWTTEIIAHQIQGLESKNDNSRNNNQTQQDDNSQVADNSTVTYNFPF